MFQGTSLPEYEFRARVRRVSYGLLEEEKEQEEKQQEEEEKEDAKLLDVRVQHPQGNSPAGYELTVGLPAGVLNQSPQPLPERLSMI